MDLTFLSNFIIALIAKLNLELIQKIHFYRGRYFSSNEIESYLATIDHRPKHLSRFFFFLLFPFFLCMQSLEDSWRNFSHCKETQFVILLLFENLFGQRQAVVSQRKGREALLNLSWKTIRSVEL